MSHSHIDGLESYEDCGWRTERRLVCCFKHLEPALLIAQIGQKMVRTNKQKKEGGRIYLLVKLDKIHVFIAVLPVHGLPLESNEKLLITTIYLPLELRFYTILFSFRH